jgi:5-methylcytosine-specific restriction endonuclease McrA
MANAGMCARAIQKLARLVVGIGLRLRKEAMPTKPQTHQQLVRQSRPRVQHQHVTEAQRIRSSARWQETRERYSRAHPLCRDPYGQHARDGRAVVGTQVHHVRPLVLNPELAFDDDNLANLCGDCHARIELTERRGVTTYHLFVLPEQHSEKNCQ